MIYPLNILLTIFICIVLKILFKSKICDIHVNNLFKSLNIFILLQISVVSDGSLCMYALRIWKDIYIFES